MFKVSFDFELCIHKAQLPILNKISRKGEILGNDVRNKYTE